MKNCQYYKTCGLFNQENRTNIPKLLGSLQKRYCMAHFEECARYRVAVTSGKLYVPVFMLPTQDEWAELIIKEQKDEQANAKVRQPSLSLQKV